MKYKYVVDSQDPYRSHVEEAESKKLVERYTGEQILHSMGDIGVLNEMYEILVRENWMHPGDILAPERP